jgi:ubiquinone/menaquinone biosynthesis C-methylase UbiE
MSNQPAQRDDQDIFRLANSMDDATVQIIADRLEFRAADQGYTEISQAYFNQLPLTGVEQVITIGCGTGVEVRALKRFGGNSLQIAGVDHSQKLIEVAESITTAEGLSSAVSYSVGDAHHLEFPDERFDVAMLHTLVSHVDDPLQVLREARRVTKIGGTVAIFDGDYRSITFGYPDHEVEREVEDLLMGSLIANPRVMRDMPRLLKEAELDLVQSSGYLYADIGSGSFWANVPEAYSGVLERSGKLPKATLDAWRAYQKDAVSNGTFFAASNYYAYIARRS